MISVLSECCCSEIPINLPCDGKSYDVLYDGWVDDGSASFSVGNTGDNYSVSYYTTSYYGFENGLFCPENSLYPTNQYTMAQVVDIAMNNLFIPEYHYFSKNGFFIEIYSISGETGRGKNYNSGHIYFDFLLKSIKCLG